MTKLRVTDIKIEPHLTLFYCRACWTVDEYNGTKLDCTECKAPMVECGFIESMTSIEPESINLNCE